MNQSENKTAVYNKSESLNDSAIRYGLRYGVGRYAIVEKAFKDGHDHATASLIQTIENRAIELDDMQLQVEDWQLQEKYHYAANQLRNLLTLIKS